MSDPKGSKEAGADDYDPFEHRNIARPTNDFETFVHILSAAFGSGILGLPFAFSKAGLTLGLICAPIIVCIVLYGMHQLVKCSQLLCRRRRVPFLDYKDTAYEAFKEGPGCLPKCAKCVRLSVDIFQIAALLGICCVYIVFVADNVKQVVDYYTDEQYHFDKRLYMLVELPLLLPLNMILDLKYLAPVSTVATFCLLLVLALCYYYIAVDFDGMSGVRQFATIQEFPRFFALFVYSLEIVGVILPIANNMKNPRHFIHCPCIFHIGIAFVAVCYIATASVGYITYKDGIYDNITLNLPQGEILAQCVKIFAACCVFTGYSIQFYVTNNVLWNLLSEKYGEPKKWVVYLVVVGLVTLSVAFAALVPKLDIVMSLVGSFALSILGLVIPPLIEISTYHKEPGYGFCKWILWKNCFILVFGLTAFVVGTSDTIYNAVMMTQ